MKKREWAQVKVGLFVFFGLILSMGIIFFLGSEQQFFAGHYQLTAYFNNISGLRTGAQVQVSGLNVGMVESIRFPEAIDDKRVKVQLSIASKYSERIREDSLASINTLGLLGDKIVAISIGSVDKPILEDEAVLRVEEKADMFAIIDKGTQVVENINKATETINTLLKEVETGNGLIHSLIYETKERPLGQQVDEMSKELRDASKELHAIVKKINEGQGTVGALISDPSIYHDIRRLFGKLERNKLLKHVIRSRIKDLEIETINTDVETKRK